MIAQELERIGEEGDGEGEKATCAREARGRGAKRGRPGASPGASPGTGTSTSRAEPAAAAGLYSKPPSACLWRALCGGDGVTHEGDPLWTLTHLIRGGPTVDLPPRINGG